MRKKFLILLAVIIIFTMACVSAAENVTDTLEATDNAEVGDSYFYDAEEDEEYRDDTLITHDVVKYYGDKTPFKVKVLDEDYNPDSGVYVTFGKMFGNEKEKRTDSKGIVSFPINYKSGEYLVRTEIESDDDDGSYWYAINSVVIKSTVKTKELVKFSTSSKKFKIKFVDTKGKALKNTYVKVKIKGKTYKVKTNSHGIAKIKSNSFKVGVSKITVYNPKSKEKVKVPVIVLKKGLHKINIHVSGSAFLSYKKLKNGDTFTATYLEGVNDNIVFASSKGLFNSAKHTKLVKAKLFYKKNGKTVVKSAKLYKYGFKMKPLKNANLYKISVWYKDKK